MYMSDAPISDHATKIARMATYASLGAALYPLFMVRFISDHTFTLAHVAKATGISEEKLIAVFIDGEFNKLTLNDISDIALAFNGEVRFSVLVTAIQEQP